MTEIVHKLAKKAGIVKNEDHTLRAERYGCRGYIANLAELTEFAKLVGQVARADERRKHERPNEASGADQGTGDEGTGSA